jgi:hypothetical protein
MKESKAIRILDSNPGIEEYCGPIHGFLKGFKTYENDDGKVFARDAVRMCLRMEDGGRDKIILKPHQWKRGESEKDGVYDLRDIDWLKHAASKFIQPLREKFAGILNIQVVVVGDEFDSDDGYPTIEITLADKTSA